MALELMYHAEDGLYHVTGQGSCSRYEFAREAVRLSGTGARVEQVEAEQDILSAMRPSYSVLDNMMLRMSGYSLLPDWREMLEEYMGRWRTEYQESGKDGRDRGKDSCEREKDGHDRGKDSRKGNRG